MSLKYPLQDQCLPKIQNDRIPIKTKKIESTFLKKYDHLMLNFKLNNQESKAPTSSQDKLDNQTIVAGVKQPPESTISLFHSQSQNGQISYGSILFFFWRKCTVKHGILKTGNHLHRLYYLVYATSPRNPLSNRFIYRLYYFYADLKQYYYQ